MKTLIKILCLSSLCLGQFLPDDKQLASMSNYEKQIIYEQNKKTHLRALIYNYLIPSYGWLYIDNHKKGLIQYKVYPLISFGAGLLTAYIDNSSSFSRTLGYMLGATTLGIILYEPFALYKETNKYNERLHNKIFGKKDKNLSFLILPTSDGAYLNLSYKF